MRVLEYIKEANNYIETADGQRISAAQMLERFLFPPELQWVPVSKLSGGEKTPSVSVACADDGTERAAFGRTDK